MHTLSPAALSQSASAVLMVSPSGFGFDDQTARTNAFQHRSSSDAATVRRLAEVEFNEYVDTLKSRDIEVIVVTDTDVPPKPNAVFPNNWLTTWPDGRIYLYPMATASRRTERSLVVLSELAKIFKIGALEDLSAAELKGGFLESTGVMIFDHPGRLAYACISPRCDETLFTNHVLDLGYTPIAFRADIESAPVYHTNIMLNIHGSTAIVCSAAITDPHERAQVLASLRSTGHEIVDVTPAQVLAFCGNTLEVRNRRHERFLIVSASAHAAFTSEKLRILGRDKTIVPVAIPTIEQIGGGSARCMLAEIFLPHKKA